TVSSTATGSVALTGTNTGITLTIPPGSTSQSTVTFQINQLPQETVLAGIGEPSGFSAVGGVYSLVAMSGSTTSVTSFLEPLTVTIQYTSAEIEGLNESTLAIFRYDESNWIALSDCTVNTSAKTVTCTTDQFSTFGLFGSTGGGAHAGFDLRWKRLNQAANSPGSSLLATVGGSESVMQSSTGSGSSSGAAVIVKIEWAPPSQITAVRSSTGHTVQQLSTPQKVEEEKKPEEPARTETVVAIPMELATGESEHTKKAEMTKELGKANALKEQRIEQVIGELKLAIGTTAEAAQSTFARTMEISKTTLDRAGETIAGVMQPIVRQAADAGRLLTLQAKDFAISTGEAMRNALRVGEDMAVFGIADAQHGMKDALSSIRNLALDGFKQIGDAAQDMARWPVETTVLAAQGWQSLATATAEGVRVMAGRLQEPAAQLGEAIIAMAGMARKNMQTALAILPDSARDIIEITLEQADLIIRNDIALSSQMAKILAHDVSKFTSIAGNGMMQFAGAAGRGADRIVALTTQGTASLSIIASHEADAIRTLAGRGARMTELLAGFFEDTVADYSATGTQEIADLFDGTRDGITLIARNVACALETGASGLREIASGLGGDLVERLSSAAEIAILNAQIGVDESISVIASAYVAITDDVATVTTAGRDTIALIAQKIGGVRSYEKEIAKHSSAPPEVGPAAPAPQIAQKYRTTLYKKNNQLMIASVTLGIFDSFGTPYAHTPVVLFSTPKVATTNSGGIATFHDVKTGTHQLEIHISDDKVEKRDFILEPPSDLTIMGDDHIDVILPTVSVVVSEPVHAAAKEPIIPYLWAIIVLLAAGNVGLAILIVRRRRRRRKELIS
ncbi:MAG: hypothetical protein PHH13_05715, partial [Candidatus Peribacteraceae bacterium]|nr:hypothetical protein [Candidatus Peribacteraceae bacterium]